MSDPAIDFDLKWYELKQKFIDPMKCEMVTVDDAGHVELDGRYDAEQLRAIAYALEELGKWYDDNERRKSLRGIYQ